MEQSACGLRSPELPFSIFTKRLKTVLFNNWLLPAAHLIHLSKVRYINVFVTLHYNNNNNDDDTVLPRLLVIFCLSLAAQYLWPGPPDSTYITVWRTVFGLFQYWRKWNIALAVVVHRSTAYRVWVLVFRPTLDSEHSIDSSVDFVFLPSLILLMWHSSAELLTWTVNLSESFMLS